MSRLISPNELMEAAKQTMLEGDDPVTQEDWQLIVNFMAANIERNAALGAVRLLKVMYDIPLSDEEIEEITKFQMERSRL